MRSTIRGRAGVCLLVSLSLATPIAFGADATAESGLSWLRKMAAASRGLNYSGTFVYHHGGRSETSRIVHYVNSAGGEFEKMETLDGPAREIIRTNDQVTCYLPESKTVLIEKRGKRRFPSLLPEKMSGVSENYSIRVAGTDRVAGQDCQVIVLAPKDKLRYGHRFCADRVSGLPLRARSFNEKNEPLEYFAFTEFKIGGKFDRERVRSRYASRSREWRVDHSAFSTSEMPARTGWVLTHQPTGFRKMTEMKRTFAGRSFKVAHIVYSDGLAAVSVFIEPLPKARIARSLSHQGAVNIFIRPVSDFMVTVLGEAPATTVMQIANSLEYRGEPPR